MTRDGFIQSYMKKSDLDQSHRTRWGFIFGEHVRVALPCDCGEELCSGWKMVNPVDEVEFQAELKQGR